MSLGNFPAAMLVALTALVLLLQMAAAQQASPNVKPLPEHWTRGVNFFAFSANDLADPRTLTELAQLPSVLPGVDMVAVQFMWHQDYANSSTVERFHKTPSTESLITFTNAAHTAGLRVYYKPLVVGGDGSQMAQLNPTNISEWFETYTSLLLDLAALAQDLNVERIAVGIELQLLATPNENLFLWESLVQSTRALYNGEVTYGSNPLTGETQLIPFWPLLDVIGIDLYIPMVFGPNSSMTPTQDEMLATYRNIFEWKVGQWYASNTSVTGGNKMFVSESGYPSSNMGMVQPWVLPSDDNCTGGYEGNNTAQAFGFATQFEVLAQDPIIHKWFNGFIQFWYGQPGTSDYIGSPPGVDQGPTYACGWTPAGKNETLMVLQSAFSRLTPPPPPPLPIASATPTTDNNDLSPSLTPETS